MRCSSRLLRYTLLLLFAACSAPFVLCQIALTHVNVVNVRDGSILRDATVVIVGTRISNIERGQHIHLPKHTRTINAQDKYLIPGLWDMHVHTLWDSQRPVTFFPLFLANGVTGVREMGGPMPAVDQVRWRNRVASGAVLGPRLVVPGPFVDGPHPVWPGSIKVSTAEEGRQAVDSLKAAGVDFVKVYTNVPRAAYFGIAEESKRDHIPFVGHVPVMIGEDEASDAGQKSIEHLMGVLLYTSSQSEQLTADLVKGVNVNQLNNEMVDTYSPARAASLFALLVKNGTWQVPTLTIRHARPYLTEVRAATDQWMKYMPKAIIDSWLAPDARQPTAPEVLASRKRVFQKEMEVVGSMHRAGVNLLAGTDTPNLYDFPGFSLHDELGFMVQAGLTPLEALQTATINPAKFLGLSETIGIIEIGKIADLVLLDANPLENISNTKRIEAVVTNGRFLDRKDLDGMLAGVATNVAKEPKQ